MLNKDLKNKYYKDLPSNLEEWLRVDERLPDSFLLRLKKIDLSGDIISLVKKVRETWLSTYKGKRSSAHSFSDSRFTSINEMFNRRMATCGSATKIIGTALRELGIPVKFIHGILGFQEKSFIKRVILKNRHAWLEVYIQSENIWKTMDPTRKDLSMYPDAKKIKEYHDWSELKKDYKKRNF